MKIIIDIPEEFESHFELDRFDDSLCRLRTDAHCVAGKYERELCDMLIEAFSNGTTLPKGHGDLIDRKELTKYPPIWMEDKRRTGEDDAVILLSDILKADAIIKADKEE